MWFRQFSEHSKHTKCFWIALAISMFEMYPIFSMWLFVCVSQFYPCHFIFVCVFLLVKTFSDVPSPNCDTRIVHIRGRILVRMNGFWISTFDSCCCCFLLLFVHFLRFVIYTYSFFIPFDKQTENRENIKTTTRITEAFTCEYEYESSQMVFASLVSNSFSLTIFRIETKLVTENCQWLSLTLFMACIHSIHLM